MGFTHNINSGNISERELVEYYGKGEFVYAKYRDDITKPNSPYVNRDYYHPETGEKLRVERAFCPETDFNKCYYVELRGKDGRGYYYADESKVMSQDGEGKIIRGKTLDRQLVEDGTAARQAREKAQQASETTGYDSEHTPHNNGYSEGFRR